jgi:alkylhydroperoxidase family enzyme
VQRSVQAEQQGVTESEYGDLTRFRESDRFTPRERAALAWTEAIALDASLADDALWAELHRQFSEPELVELGFFIALTLGQQRWIKTLALDHGEVLGDQLTGIARTARPNPLPER